MDQHSFEYLKKFAKEQAEIAKKQSRDLFELFKQSAFPDGKKDALDYETVCRIEDEFRTQEKKIEALVDEELALYITNAEHWLASYDILLSGYLKIATSSAHSLTLKLRAHQFTYWDGLDQYPAHQQQKIVDEGCRAHAKLLRDIENESERISQMLQKKKERLSANYKTISKSFEDAMDECLNVVIPASLKQIEALINQNYLQRVGGMDNVN